MKVKLVATFDMVIPNLQPDGVLEIPDGADVASVVHTFKLNRRLKPHLPVWVNGQPVDHTHILHDGDEMTIRWPMLAGG